MDFHPTPHIYLPHTGIRFPMDRWEFEEQALEKFSTLERDDPSAYRYIVQLLERWARSGADHADRSLKAPVGYRALRKVTDPPWLGEITEAEFPDRPKPSKAGQGRQYRLYFLDITPGPGDPERMMLVSLYAEKRHLSGASSNQSKVRDAQDQDMIQAMRSGQHWCRENGRQYRRWNSTE